MVPPGVHAAPECDDAPGFGGLNTITIRDDCTAEIGILDGATCVGGWGSRVERDAAGHTVRILVCNGGIPDRLPPIDIGTAERPCPAGFATPWPVSQVVGVYLDSRSCHVTIGLLFGYWCVLDPGHVDQTVNRVTVQTPNCPVRW